MFARDKRIGPYTYVYLVENVREEGRTKQRIIANLGRKEVVEGQAGGVHEDDAEFGEQVAPTGKQPLFHGVLAAARLQPAGSGLIGGGLAEPSHGAVEMMQLKGLSALDPVVGSPLFRSAGRAPHKPPVEHRQEYRALGSKLELPACGQLL